MTHTGASTNTRTWHYIHTRSSTTQSPRLPCGMCLQQPAPPACLLAQTPARVRSKHLLQVPRTRTQTHPQQARGHRTRQVHRRAVFPLSEPLYAPPSQTTTLRRDTHCNRHRPVCAVQARPYPLSHTIPMPVPGGQLFPPQAHHCHTRRRLPYQKPHKRCPTRAQHRQLASAPAHAGTRAFCHQNPRTTY